MRHNKAVSPLLTHQPGFDLTAVICLEIRLMLDATEATVKCGKGLALTCPTDMKAAHQPYSWKKLKAVQLRNGA
jgi:hypothetical protein